MKTKLLPLLFASVVFFVSSSNIRAQVPDIPSPNGKDLRDLADPQDTVNAINRLGVDILQKEIQKDPTANIILSPYSIQTSLAMAYIGSDGSTREEMQKTLHYPKSKDELLSGFKMLLYYISFETKPNSNIKTANTLFIQNDFTLNPDFIKTLNEIFDAQVSRADFSQPEKASREINSWISENTGGKIPDIISKDAIQPNTKLALINAIYLNMPWSSKFDKALTEDKDFYLAPDHAIKVSVMFQKNKFGYYKTNGYEIVTLDYVGNNFRCIIFLPEKETEKQRTFNTTVLKDAFRALPRDVSLYLPRFKISSPSISLKDVLKSLGMTTAFSLEANFSKIVENNATVLYIQDILHKAFIDVTEEGTEGGAASVALSIPMSGGGTTPKEVTVIVDRPFYFAIQHRMSGTCIFLGKINNPIE